MHQILGEISMRAYAWTTLLVLSVSVVGCSDRVDFYQTVNEARSPGGGFHTGWIPSLLPPSARDIHVRYHPGSGGTWITFEYDPVDRAQMLRDVRRVGEEELRRIFIQPTTDSWWDHRLSPAGLSHASESFPFQVFEHRHDVGWSNENMGRFRIGYLALHPGTTRAYYWSCGERVREK